MKDEGGAHKVFWYVYLDRFSQFAKYSADLAHAIRAIIEQEQGIVIYCHNHEVNAKQKG